MKKTRLNADLALLDLNEGQLDWLPRNPRTWTQTDIDLTVESIREDPDFLEDRPALAVALGDRLIVFAGNLRTRAAGIAGETKVPVVVYEPATAEDKAAICRRAIKDNGSFGSWDVDALANEWNVEPAQLDAWGVPEWISGGAGKEAPAPSVSKTGEINPESLQDTVTFKVDLSAEEFSFVKRVINQAGDTEREGLLNLLGYDGE